MSANKFIALPSSKEKSEGNDLLVFVSTTAYHKVRMYQDAAERLNVRAHFLSIDLLYRAMAQTPEESGSTKGNAKEKHDLLKSVIKGLDVKDEKNIARIIKEIIADLGLNSPIILFEADDAAVTLEAKVWKKLDKTGARAVLKNHRGRSGPGAELGPFVSAIGGTGELLKRIHKAKNTVEFDFTDEVTGIFQQIILEAEGLKLKKKALKITKEGTVSVRGQQEREVNKTSTSPVTLHDRAGVIHDLTKDQIHRLPRASIVQKLAKIFSVKKGQPAKINENGSIPEGANLALIADGFRADEFAKQIRGVCQNIFCSATLAENSEIDNLIAANDGFVFVNQERLSPKSFLELVYTVNSIIVAKQTDGRDSQKPIILVDLYGGKDDKKGDLRRVANIHRAMAQAGFIKEGEFKRILDVGDGCIAYANNYFILIQTSEIEKAKAAANKVLEKEFENYRRPHFEEITAEKVEIGKSQIAKHSVAILCSASNQNDHLSEASYEISRFIASLGFNVSWGAMDKYMGQRIIEGFEDGKIAENQALIGVSTPVLKLRETDEGKFDERTDIKITTPNLSKRTEAILKPLGNDVDIVTVLPGGSGTLVEIIKHLHNNLSRKNPIPMIIYNPPFPDEEHRYSEKMLRKISHGIFEDDAKNKAALLNIEIQSQEALEARKQTGIYVVDSIQEYKKLFLELCKEREINVETKQHFPEPARH